MVPRFRFERSRDGRGAWDDVVKEMVKETVELLGPGGLEHIPPLGRTLQ